jgi:hypothetical protein
MARCETRGEVKGKLANGVVASTLTLPRNMAYPALLPLMRTPRLPAVDRTDAPADLNGLVIFAERRNVVSACVPSHFKRTLPHFTHTSHASKLLLKRSMEMKITRHEIGFVGLSRSIISHYQSADSGSCDIHQSEDRLAERGFRDLM